MLPGLVQEGKQRHDLAARWQPVTDGPRDAPRLAQLRQAMPPVCRAQVDLAAATSEPRRLLTGFLDAMTMRWHAPGAAPPRPPEVEGWPAPATPSWASSARRWAAATW